MWLTDLRQRKKAKKWSRDSLLNKWYGDNCMFTCKKKKNELGTNLNSSQS